MGDVHEFRRPPKNKRQFEGYRPDGPLGKRPARRRLRPWQKSMIAWIVLMLAAAALWGLDRLL